MSDGDKSSASSMPAILVLILGVLGIAAIPQAGSKSSSSVPKPASNSTASANLPASFEDDEKNLGPLATIKSDRATWPPVVAPPRCPKVMPTLPPMRRWPVTSDAVLFAEPDLRFLIALVPDPYGTSMSHEFDLTLSSIQRATESAGFVVVRWSAMPGFPTAPTAPPSVTPPPVAALEGVIDNKPFTLKGVDRVAPAESTPWPAALLCRATAAAAPESKQLELLILLVPESPTLGVDKARFASALNLIVRHRDLHQACEHPPTQDGPVADGRIRVIGPNFSGSIRSIVQELESFAPKPPVRISTPEVILYNGRASSVDPTSFAKLPPGWIRFQSTVYSNDQLTSALRKFVGEITPPWGSNPRFAILNESNTAFGQTPRQFDSETQYFSFPMNISQIRDEYAARGYLTANEPLKLQAPERLTPLEMAGPRGTRDLVPLATPGPSAVGAETNLSQLLLSLERGHFSWIGINATNPYDRLFLAEKIRVACPDSRLFFVDASTLYAHPTAVPYLRGSLVVSTYPLDPDTQAWTASPAARDRTSRITFGSDCEEGVYNATLAHFADFHANARPNFLDYHYPGGNPLGHPLRVPSVWIGVVGQRGIYQLAVKSPEAAWVDQPACQAPAIGSIYRPDAEFQPPTVPSTGIFDTNWLNIFLTVVFASILGSAWYLRLCSRRFLRLIQIIRPGQERDRGFATSPGMIEIIDHQTSRKLAAIATSAGFGQMVLLSSPIWILLEPNEALIRVTTIRQVSLIGLALLAHVMLGVAALFAISRMIRTDFGGRSRRWELIYRSVVGVVSLAQIFLPVFFVVWMMLSTDAANLRLFSVRVTRLVDGVTPMVPFLLMGLTGGMILFGDWRRVGLRVRLGATGAAESLDPGPLAQVWIQFCQARLCLEHPLKGWKRAGALLSLPFWVALVLVTMAMFYRLPTTVEPSPLFGQTFLLAYCVTVGFLVMRILDLVGMSRVFDELLRRLAELPLARAFDRIPAHFAHENFWRPMAPTRQAGDDSDRRVDHQFALVDAGYVRNRATFPKTAQLRLLDQSVFDRVDELIEIYRTDGVLQIRWWWPVVAALVPFLKPFWTARSAIVTGDPKDEDEWAGLTNAELRSWLHAVEDLIALILVRQIAWLRAAVDSLLGFLVVGLVTMTLVMTSYPFEPHSPMLMLIGVLTVITLGAIVIIAVQASRDEVLSRLNKTATDRFTLDRNFVSTMLTFVVPLLGLFGALSYSLSDLVRSLFEPFLRGG